MLFLILLTSLSSRTTLVIVTSQVMCRMNLQLYTPFGQTPPSVTFTLSADGDQNYYIGVLIPPHTTSVNYTVTEDILQYDVTNLTAITWSLPLPPGSTDCSISLSDYTTPANSVTHSPERYVCILVTSYGNDVDVIFKTNLPTIYRGVGGAWLILGCIIVTVIVIIILNICVFC